MSAAATDDKETEPISGATLRAVMRQVPAPVTVVTACSEEGVPFGVTIGSFTSVSLRPPLVSFNIAEEAQVYALLEAADYFAVHVLRRRQAPLAVHFADPDRSFPDQFEDVVYRTGPGAVPVLEGALAVLYCRSHARFSAGDSDIIVGRVIKVEGQERLPDAEEEDRSKPLVYHQCGYRSVEVEAQALDEEKRPSRLTPETPAPKSAKS